MDERVWVTVMDMYDRDTSDLGPFEPADAHRYCDAVNGQQLKPGASSSERPPFGVWNQATTHGYDFVARMRHLLQHPNEVPPDADGIAAAAGALSKYEWERRRLAQIPIDSCWCAELRAGNYPKVEQRIVSAYFDRYVTYRSSGVRVGTQGHDGDVSESECTMCGGTLLHLMIEHEGLGDSIHHYYVPVDAETLAAVHAGRLHRGNLESWFGDRPGIYADRGSACFYYRARVGYAGVDSSLDLDPP